MTTEPPTTSARRPDVTAAESLPFEDHPGLRHSYSDQGMTLGVITPLEGFEGAVPGLEGHVELIQQAEQAGFGTVWVRDVPLLDPQFGDTGQVFDVWTYLGYLAASTSKVALGTASVVLPLRNPLHTAKAATSIDQLTGGRFLFGVATGDRAVEFPVFGADHDTRGDAFRQRLAAIRKVTEQRFPNLTSTSGTLSGVDVLPKPTHGRLPYFLTGTSRQSVEWIAENADGWLFYTLPLEQQKLNLQRWRRLTAPKGQPGWKPFNQATYFDLLEDPTAEPTPIRQGLSLGREPLLEMLKAWEGIGIDQSMVNFKHSSRPVAEVLAEMKEHILPHFPLRTAA